MIRCTNQRRNTKSYATRLESSNSGALLDMVSTGASTTIAQSAASTEHRPAIMSDLLRELNEENGHTTSSGKRAHDISRKALKVTNKAS